MIQYIHEQVKLDRVDIMSESRVVHVTVAPSSVNNNAGGMSRPVCITPLPANMQPLLSALQTVRSKEKQTVRHANSVKSNPVNLNVKIINPDKKRLCETYVLHNVPVSEITTIKVKGSDLSSVWW